VEPEDETILLAETTNLVNCPEADQYRLDNQITARS